MFFIFFKQKSERDSLLECFTWVKYPFGKDYFCQFILLFSLFLLLFMGPTTLFDTIHESHDTITTNFYLYL